MVYLSEPILIFFLLLVPNLKLESKIDLNRMLAAFYLLKKDKNVQNWCGG